MLSLKFVLLESENFTSGPAIRAPPTILIYHYFSSRNQKNRNRATGITWCRSPILLFHANLFAAKACVKHSNLFKVNDQDPRPNQMNGRTVLLKDVRRANASKSTTNPERLSSDPQAPKTGTQQLKKSCWARRTMTDIQLRAF